MERGLGKPSSYLECFEWFLAPTDFNGLNPDTDKSPHVINNSWYCATFEGCTDLSVNELLHTAVINLKAAGVVVVVSNGNDGGTWATTSNPPAYFEESFSVGATRSNDTIAGFSSRGPGIDSDSCVSNPTCVWLLMSVPAFVRVNTPIFQARAWPDLMWLVWLRSCCRRTPHLAGDVAAIETIIEESAVYLADTLDCAPNSPGWRGRTTRTAGAGLMPWLPVNAALAYAPVPVTEAARPEAGVFPTR